MEAKLLCPIHSEKSSGKVKSSILQNALAPNLVARSTFDFTRTCAFSQNLPIILWIVGALTCEVFFVGKNYGPMTIFCDQLQHLSRHLKKCFTLFLHCKSMPTYTEFSGEQKSILKNRQRRKFVDKIAQIQNCKNINRTLYTIHSCLVL